MMLWSSKPSAQLLQRIKIWSLQNLLIILCTVLSYVTRAAGLIPVFGYEGRDVKISCPYEEGYESYEKYLCKNCKLFDNVLITTSQGKRERFSIYDDKTTRTFTTTMYDLHFDDAGTYYCGITRAFQDIYAEVQLDVRKDSCCDEVAEIQSHEGGSASIRCPYEPESVSNLKFICRGKQPSSCLQQALVTSDRQNNGPIRLTDDRKSGTFTVSISSLTLEDSGSYLCGVQTNTGPDVFSAAELEVKASPQKTTTMSLNNTAGLVTSLSPSQREPEAALYVVFVVPAVMLLIPVIVLVKVCLHRCYKVKEVVTNENRLEALEHQEEMRAESVYENHDLINEQRTSKQQSSDFRDEDREEPDYENILTSEGIYCNENIYKKYSRLKRCQSLRHTDDQSHDSELK